MGRVNENLTSKWLIYIFESRACISELKFTIINLSSFCLVSLLHTLPNLLPHPSPSLRQQWQRNCATPLKKVTGLKWNQRWKKKKKTREECWWFNQGSRLSIRHYADGEMVSERHRRGGRESQWENEKKTRKEWLWKYYRTARERERSAQRRSGKG